MEIKGVLAKKVAIFKVREKHDLKKVKSINSIWFKWIDINDPIINEYRIRNDNLSKM